MQTFPQFNSAIPHDYQLASNSQVQVDSPVQNDQNRHSPSNISYINSNNKSHQTINPLNVNHTHPDKNDTNGAILDENIKSNIFNNLNNVYFDRTNIQDDIWYIFSNEVALAIDKARDDTSAGTDGIHIKFWKGLPY